MRLVTTKAASKDSLQSVPFIVQYESRNNQVHFLGAKIGIISESSKFFATLITSSMGDLNFEFTNTGCLFEFIWTWSHKIYKIFGVFLFILYFCKQVSANRRDATLLWQNKNKASAEALV